MLIFQFHLVNPVSVEIDATYSQNRLVFCSRSFVGENGGNDLQARAKILVLNANAAATNFIPRLFITMVKASQLQINARLIGLVQSSTCET